MGDDSNEYNYPMRFVFAQGIKTSGEAEPDFDRVAKVSFFQVETGFDRFFPEKGFQNI